MTPPSTHVLKSISLKPSVLERRPQHAAALFGVGFLLAGVHQAWDFSLGLPGHFGLVWMAAIMLARAGSPLAFAALLTAVGYVAGSGAFGGFAMHAFAQAPGYLLVALLVDAAWRVSPALVRQPLFAGLIGGFAFAGKPLVMLAAVGLFGIKAGALRHGLSFPLVTHFGFGVTGAVIGALLWGSAQPSQPERRLD